MADTDIETLQNGTATLSLEEEERLKQRPADIDADVREMERRKRVEALMSSKLFREELERVLDQQMHEGGDAPLLQRIREMVGGRLHSGSMRGPTCVLPINDIRGIEGVGYEKGEKILRCKLAAVYRLVDLFGWTQTGVNGQITARLNTAVESVLTTPRGLLPHEVTASSLVKVDMQGAVQDQGTTNFPINVEGFSLHAAVHAARPDIRCVLHVRSASALAVSCMSGGLLPLCHEACALGECVSHRAPKGILDNEEKDKLVRALGPHSKVLILSNSGALCCGATLEEAFHHARLLVAAADVQLRLASIPLDRLELFDEETRKQIYDAAHKPPNDQAKWRVGGEEFEGLMRMLDNAGFRTGYIYRHPLIKNDVPKPKNDVEVPPAVSSLGYLLEEEELYKQGLWKKGGGKTGERTRWLNSPNVYQKVEVLETGTTDPKKITKWVDANTDEWVQDGSPAHSSTPVKIDTLQFVPKNTNPKEFKKLQQQIKENRRADKISAGPQSHILEGVTWDEASKLVGEDAVNTQTGDHVVLMGAASKGIIQRGYQHNATMYSAPYARNPFDHVTDTEIEDYRRAVERKRTGNEYDTDLSESEAISGAQITSPASAPSETEEESRDEHRVLRIETTQAPIRSQPEVVLSDVDTTDFLNAERSHADRTKDTRDPTVMSDDDVFLPAPAPRGPIVARAHHRDPNLLSDDEVFLDSAASTVTSSVSGVTSPQPPPRNVIIRAQTIAVAQKLQGTNENDEALTCSQRSRHDFPRSPSFDSIVKIYDSPEIIDAKTHPKCKVSLSNKLDNADFKNYGFAKVSVSKRLEVGDAKSLNKLEEGITSSRSSLYSIASIEWDGRCKSEHAFRTRSLPRQRISSLDIYRTRSHSGFINSYIRDPEPLHYHIPRCRSCSAVNISPRSVALKTKLPTSLYLSVDNIHLKSNNETEIVKVKEVELPLFKVPQVPEFVDSQEFNEDNYLADVNSFSSNNQTVIEKNCDVTLTKEEVDDEKTSESVERSSELYRAEYAQIETDENDNTMETEGEYQSFSDDFEEAYESPVKDLVEKDIRDYSVPINFYCEDYRKDSPKKSPLKCREQPKNVLEPILEESKSSYGDDSGNLSQDKQEFDVKAFAEKTVGDVIDVALTVVESNQDCGVRNEDAAEIDVKTNDDNSCKVVDTKIEKETEFKSKKLYENNKENNVQSSDDVNLPHNIKMFGNVKTPKFDDVEIPTVIELSPNDIDNKNDGLFNSDHKLVDDKDQRKSSIEYSVTSTPNEIASFDSTVEFEIYEAITDLLACILNKIDYEGIGREFFNLPEKKHAINLFDEKDSKTPALVDEREVNNIVNIKNVKENITENTDNNFSITKLIQEFEETYPILLNDTILTESSDGGITEPFKIVESLMYYIFDRVFVIENGKNKKKANKRVVTVVDSEDIMYTAATLWPDYDENENFGVVFNRQEEINDAYEVIAENENVVDANNNEGLFEILEAEIEDPNSWAEFDVNEHRNENADMNDGSEHASLEKRNNQYRDEFAPNENNIVTEFNDANDLRSTNSKHEKYEEETEVEFHGYDTNESNQDPCLTTESLNETEFEMVLNTNMDLIQNDHTAACNKDISTTDDKECKELSRISIEITEDIAFEYKTSTTNDYENDELDDYDDDIKVDNDFTNDTQVDESDEEYTDDVTTSKNKDTMNTAFVNDEFHSHSSSPCKESQIFDACDESPIRKPTNSFIGQELTIKYKDDTLLGSPFVKYDDVPSPFVKQSSVISMSQTENSGGIKYWLSFDDSFTESRDYKRRSIKNTDDTIPSFYGINFSDRLNAFNKRSILINDNSDGTVESQKDSVQSPTSSNCYDTCESAMLDDSVHKPYDENNPKYQSNSPQHDINSPQFDVNSSQYDINSSQYDINSSQYDVNSPLYDVNSRYDFESPRNLFGVENPETKLLYEVPRRNDRLCMSWPPFEDTLFYRIISKFRMSESFDPSELEDAKINTSL